jgi:Cdc6-like AAA superfamily ATPase
LIGGEDGDLGGARKKMDKDLTRLQNATEFAILGNSEELKKMNGELQVNQAAHTRMLEEQKEIMFSISQDTENIRTDVAKLLKAFTEQNAKHDHKGKPSTQDAGKPATASRVRNAMPDVEGEGHEYKILKETLIPDTCTWVFSQPEWEAWMKRDEGDTTALKPILALAGQPGTGKSHLAATVYDKLYSLAQEDSSQRTCVAHFYFREQHKDLGLFLKGLVTVINQVVEQSAPLCERINAEMVRDEVYYNVWVWKDLLLKILGPSFSQDSSNRLFILFDGLDELFDFPQFLEFVKLVKEEKFRISIVVTSRPELLQKVSEQAEVSTIEVTKEKQLPDFKTLAWHRINDLGYLKRFTRYVQQRIAEKVEEVSPSKSTSLRQRK